MIYRRTARFKRAYQSLPEQIRSKVKQAFALFQEDLGHPSLGVKKVQGHPGIWEGRIDRQYRFTFHFERVEGAAETFHPYLEGED